ncbi:MBL fold metallo-hydrolase [Phenylobacterium sp. LH3H17]|uniref:MBL fold metallo-hydrolase n=1 Tax=Phenylobacterium sp. LH3H17 TaxID=2903901 RepID=UPI0020C96891|nr:MBL fold metallo-hydrolase [Phenylobacterium sp. LH3H17]UTP39523.1 MBL fold metallo-hydrolase [Phenylobacterium sp. LH3H17]
MIRTILTLWALALAGPAVAAALTPAQVFARETTAVAPHIWLIAKPAVTDPPFEGNVVVIEQARGLVVVDAGGAPVSGQAVVAQIRKLSGKPVSWLVYTHYHGDHNLGAGAVRAAWPGVQIVSSARTRENMTGPPMAYVTTYGKSYGEMAAFAAAQAGDAKLPQALRDGWRRAAEAGPAMVEAYSDLKPYPADLTFESRIKLADEVAPVEIAYLGRANTDGDVVVWAPKQRVLATGDIVVAPIPYAAHTFPGDWIEVLRKLKAYDFKLLIPGHGPPQTDRAYLDRLIAALESVRAQVAPLAKADLPLDEVRRRIDLEPIRKAFAGDDPWLRYVLSAVFTGDLIANAYKEARGETVIQGKG